MRRLSKISVVTAMATALSSAPGAQAAVTRYEVESTPAVCSGVVASNHSGHSGSGFCDTPNAIGSAVRFKVNVNGSVAQPGFGFEGTGA